MVGAKRSQDQEESLLKENVIIVDIEGTTTSISFVKETLFPYVRDNVKTYIDAKWDDEEFKRDLEKLKEQAKQDEESKTEGLVPISGANVQEEKESVVRNVLWQMDNDRKTGALKQLQGHMWREAYESGKVKGHVYEDVPECLKLWTDAGKKIYVYSSGSVEAQKLLYGHSEHGDLLKYFSGYFDTEIGMKQEADSYKNILTQVKAESTDAIFLTDIVKEAKAAKEAGLSTIIMIREGNGPLSDEEKSEFRTAKSFLDLPFLNSTKRQKLDSAEMTEKKETPKEAPVIGDKMEVSEDVEMTDMSDKDCKSKVENIDTKVESKPEETKDTVEETLTSEAIVAKDEAMETDDKPESVKKSNEDITKNAEALKESKAEIVESKKESPDSIKEGEQTEEILKAVSEDKVSTKPEENPKKLTIDETDKAVLTDSNQIEVSEQLNEVSEKKSDATKKNETGVVGDEMEDGSAAADVTKATKVCNDTTETKTEEPEKKLELSKAKEETETENAQIGSTSAAAKESCIKIDSLPNESEKAEAKTADDMVESEKITKPNETTTKSEAVVSKSDDIMVKETLKENGTSKTDVPLKVETETAAIENKEDLEVKKTEPKVDETVSELKESETKSKDEIKQEAREVTEAKKEDETKDNKVGVKSVEEKESDKEEVKTETTMVASNGGASSTVEPIKKINGTTQNGDSATSDETSKVHTNGVNDACASNSADAKTNKEASPQKRESESSADTSAESIKVKKVVDSTVADGAGEPDVVPPVVVAATS